MRDYVAWLALGERHSVFSPERHTEVVAYVENVFRWAGLEVRRHTFAYQGRSGVNVIGRREGSDSALPPLLVSAHYDTVPGSPGADDNASGVAALLECAGVLATAPLRRAVDFVAFDMEETQPEGEGLIGSTAYVREVASSGRPEGVYNLEMIGFTSGPGTQNFPPGFHLLLPHIFQHVRERDFRGESMAVVSQGGGVSLSQRMATAVAEHVPELDVVPIDIRAGMPVPPDMFRSDHAPFWVAGIPAVMVTDTANFRNRNYHTPQDTADTLDYAFLHRVTCALVATLAKHAAD